MAIQFNSLPGNKPGFAVPPKGHYIAVIDKAEMKQPKDPSKDLYLSLTLNLSDETGKSFGKIFDMITTSDSDYSRYKLKRFIEALELPIKGSFELKDLTKMVQGKKLRVDVAIDDRGDQPKAVVDIFTDEIFYPLEDKTPVINAADALDEEVADVFGGSPSLPADEDTEY